MIPASVIGRSSRYLVQVDDPRHWPRRHLQSADSISLAALTPVQSPGIPGLTLRYYLFPQRCLKNGQISARQNKRAGLHGERS